MSIFGGGAPSGAEVDAWNKVLAVFERFNAADNYLFSIPMWNASIPYVLKHLIDIITRRDGDAPMSVKWWVAGFRVVGSSGVRVFV